MKLSDGFLSSSVILIAGFYDVKIFYYCSNSMLDNWESYIEEATLKEKFKSPAI